MENSQLEARKRIDLIERMIENTQRRIVRNAGRPFLYWGYATVAVALAVWQALRCTGDPRWNLLWFALPLVGGTLMLLDGRKRATTPEGQVRTYVDTVVSHIWTVMGIAGGMVSCTAFLTHLPILCIVLLLMGCGTAITGLVIRFRILLYGGLAGIVLAPATLAAHGWALPLFAAGFVVMMIVPGHLLNREAERLRHV